MASRDCSYFVTLITLALVLMWWSLNLTAGVRFLFCYCRWQPRRLPARRAPPWGLWESRAWATAPLAHPICAHPHAHAHAHATTPAPPFVSAPTPRHTLLPLSPLRQDDFEAEFEDDADERLLRKMPSPLPTPSPSPITGPQLMRPLVGECYQFTGKDGNGDENRYEVCGYKSVRQTIVKNGHSYSTGYWAKWMTTTEGGTTKYTAHLYNDGESCGSVRRQTTVVFECDKALKAPKLLSATEPAMCAYELRMALPQWCEIEKAVRAGGGRGPGACRHWRLLPAPLCFHSPSLTPRAHGFPWPPSFNCAAALRALLECTSSRRQCRMRRRSKGGFCLPWCLRIYNNILALLLGVAAGLRELVPLLQGSAALCKGQKDLCARGGQGRGHPRGGSRWGCGCSSGPLQRQGEVQEARLERCGVNFTRARAEK